MGLTQHKLAEMAGIDWSLIDDVESGRVKLPSAKILRMLARALKTTPEWIRGEDLTMDEVFEMADNFSLRLQRRMTELGIRQKDIIEATGKTSGAVSSWINGHYIPKGDALMNLATLLETTPEWLLTGEGDSGLDASSAIHQAVLIVDRAIGKLSHDQRALVGDLLRHLAICKDPSARHVAKESIVKMLAEREGALKDSQNERD